MISNVVNAQDRLYPNTLGASDFLWQWGQFLDHDIDLTDGVDPPGLADIAVPRGDLWFDPKGEGGVVISFNRSVYDPETGTSRDNPREQVNEITTWIDASNVYGSSAERAAALRTLDGTGRLRTSAGELLPLTPADFPMLVATVTHYFWLATCVPMSKLVWLRCIPCSCVSTIA